MTTRMLFSQRYMRAIEGNALTVDIPEPARRKLWAQLSAFNAPMRIQRDPYDNWVSSTSVLEETESDLLTEHGWQRLPVTPYPADTQYHEALRLLVLGRPSNSGACSIAKPQPKMPTQMSQSLR